MKLRITENRRDKIVLKYLDKYYGNLTVENFKKYGVKHYIDRKYTGLKIFLVENNTLFVLNRQLRDDLINLFGIELSKFDDVLIPWFEETYGDNIFRCKILDYHN